jgi:hypothetical protein
MKALSKQARADLARLADDLRAHSLMVTAAIEDFRQVIEAAFAPLGAAIETFNESAEAWNEELTAATEQIEEYVEARTDRWHEGEQAARYMAWKEALESAKIEALEAPEAPEIDAIGDPSGPDEVLPPLTLSEV